MPAHINPPNAITAPLLLTITAVSAARAEAFCHHLADWSGAVLYVTCSGSTASVFGALPGPALERLQADALALLKSIKEGEGILSITHHASLSGGADLAASDMLTTTTAEEVRAERERLASRADAIMALRDRATLQDKQALAECFGAMAALAWVLKLRPTPPSSTLGGW